MIARARAVAHGNAYTTYATLKKDAEFVCCENMAGDRTAAVTEDDLDDIWIQFKYAGENYIAKGKPVKIVGTFADDDAFGVAIRKADKELLNLVNEGYKKLHADPFWKDLNDKYLNKK